jgi:hypothetical protein
MIKAQKTQVGNSKNRPVLNMGSLLGFKGNNPTLAVTAIMHMDMPEGGQ